MKLRDKSRGEGASVPAQGSRLLPLSAVGAACGINGCGGGPAGGLFSPLMAVRMACQSSAPPPGPLPSAAGPSVCSPGQAWDERLSEVLSRLLCPSRIFPEAQSRERRSGHGPEGRRHRTLSGCVLVSAWGQSLGRVRTGLLICKTGWLGWTRSSPTGVPRPAMLASPENLLEGRVLEPSPRMAAESGAQRVGPGNRGRTSPLRGDSDRCSCSRLAGPGPL